MRITEILRQYISDRIPSKVTNILFQMFNGIHAMFENLEYRLDIVKRERNIMTAQHISSLRNLAAQNGFEPQLRTPARGLLYMKISSKLFNRVGYPLFIKPYAVFRNKTTQIEYVYVSDKTIRIDSNNYYIPVIEGSIQTTQFTAESDDLIQKFYLPYELVAENSVIVEVGGVQFEEVKSFYNNVGYNDDKQFLIKYSSDTQNPIVIYIKGLSNNDIINVTYRLTNGELGNITTKSYFDTEDIVDSFGSYITPALDEIQIVNASGFNMGSNGTDENSLRAAIGFNHNVNLLFDKQSYRNFLSKFSTILVQDIKLPSKTKQINNIYVWRKNTLSSSALDYDSINTKNIVDEYKNIIDYELYLLSSDEKTELSKILEEYEYSLSHHNLYDAYVNKYALQIMFETQEDLDTYKDALQKLIYYEFSKFLYIRQYILNVETMFDKFREENNCTFEYILFNQNIEEKKYKNLRSTFYLFFNSTH